MKNKDKLLGRREFGKLAALGSACAALPRSAAAGAETPVILAGVSKPADDAAIAKAVRRAAEAATDFAWLSRGDSVCLKPVVNSGNPYPSTTNPAGLKAMIALLKEKGAGRVVVSDMSGIEWVKLSPDKLKNSTRALMHNCGLAKAAVEAGADLYLPEEDGWEAFVEEAPQSGGSWKGPIMMPKILREMDHLVLMPRCARHVLAGSTLGMKAAVGYWRTDTRLEYHRDAATFQEKTAEANTVPSLLAKQRLVLTTATKVLTTFGPDNGCVVEPDPGLVIASASIVAHDMVSLAWLIKHRELTPASKISTVSDPNTSQFMVSNGNRLVVSWLSDARSAPGQVARMEQLTRVDLNSIWDDRVLARAFQVMGGTPKVKLVDADGTIPSEVVDDLSRRIALPA